MLLVFKAPERFLKEVNSILYKFIWQRMGKGSEKIKRNVLRQDYVDGGVNMIDIYAKQESLVMSWVKKFVSDETSTWKSVALSCLQRTGHGVELFVYNASMHTLKRKIDIAKLPCFYKYLIERWFHNKQIKEEVDLNDYLWCNCKITYKNNELFFVNWSKVGIGKVKDVLNEEINVRELGYFVNKMPNNPGIML